MMGSDFPGTDLDQTIDRVMAPAPSLPWKRRRESSARTRNAFPGSDTSPDFHDPNGRGRGSGPARCIGCALPLPFSSVPSLRAPTKNPDPEARACASTACYFEEELAGDSSSFKWYRRPRCQGRPTWSSREASVGLRSGRRTIHFHHRSRWQAGGRFRRRSIGSICPRDSRPCARAGHSLSLYFRVGDRLLSSRDRPMLEVVADSVGIHDATVPACDPTRYTVDFGVDGHRNCLENMHEPLAPLRSRYPRCSRAVQPVPEQSGCRRRANRRRRSAEQGRRPRGVFAS